MLLHIDRLFEIVFPNTLPCVWPLNWYSLQNLHYQKAVFHGAQLDLNSSFTVLVLFEVLQSTFLLSNVFEDWNLLFKANIKWLKNPYQHWDPKTMNCIINYPFAHHLAFIDPKFKIKIKFEKLFFSEFLLLFAISKLSISNLYIYFIKLNFSVVYILDCQNSYNKSKSFNRFI